MKRRHVALPTLQAAATAFLATSCQATPLYRADETSSGLVASTNGDNERDVEEFSTLEAHPDQSLDADLRKRDELAEQSLDLLLSLIRGGFGTRSCAVSPVCSEAAEDDDYRGGSGSSGYSSGGGYVGGVYVPPRGSKGGSSRGG
ncbi:uncharacterized protein DNG_08763 [Cephalotrichum gorgonifer]|uniref:Uncharacterized protein n=1 Tax=Cephalotrichum gorgonifer TaxID=2041049 RepID=A0AAE8SYP2_9PEZI|nr:uncharacterized protein DNG_08763 [Cephalotrichum gorgonifer]